MIALIGGFVLLFFVISAAMEGGDDGDSGEGSRQERVERQQKLKKTPATYTVESGDTLTSIAQETGISVERIIRLNPDVDPQILIEGEELKLK